jgi:hypothetical protein
MGVVINIIVARGAGVFQLFDMEPVGDRDVVGIDFWRSSLYIENALMAPDAVWIDLVKFGGKTSMFSIASQRENIDARHQGMACRMTLRAVDLRMHGRLLPERGPLLPLMTGDTEFLLGRRIAGQGDRCIKSQYRQDSPQTPSPKRKMGNLKFQRLPPLLVRK